MNRNIKLGVVATLLAILTCSVAVALPSTLWQKRISQYESICVHEAYDLITYKLNQTALVILDVRTRNEFNSGHIANAVNIPHTELEANLTNPSTCPLRGHENDLILVYCMAGSRAAIACEILAQDRTSGQVGKFTNVYDMVGGITEWTNPLWHYPIVYTQPATYVIISASEAYKMITNNTCKIFVDVRTQSEYNGEHIVNSTASPRTHAVNIPYNFDDTDFWNRASPTLAGHENEALILYCADNTCSKSLSACQCLIDHGFRKIYSIDDGIKAWKASGYPVWTVWTDVILNPSAEQGVARPDSWLQWTEPNALGEHIWSSDAHSGAKSLSLRLQAGSTGSRMWAQTFRTSLS
ncbi:MAG TPA: rhodanese-like domain-containing protein, partial [Candidatus Bathyarchaeia archaeon]